MTIKKEIKEEREFYPLYYDLMSKYIFGTQENVRFTENLLECYYNYPNGTLKGCKITNNVLLLPKVIRNKSFELDIMVELPNKEKINLEFYSYYQSDSEIKSLMYFCNVFSNQLNKGEEYYNTKAIHQINFVYGDHVHENKSLIKKYMILNMDDNYDGMLTNIFKIDIVDIANKDNLPYNVNERFKDWIKLIGAQSYKELKNIAKNNPIFKDVIRKMEQFAGRREVQTYFSGDILHRSQLHTETKKAEERGKLAGIAEGLAEGHSAGLAEGKNIGLAEGHSAGLAEGEERKTYEIVKNMLTKNYNIEDISEITNLSIDEIKQIRNSFKED